MSNKCSYSTLEDKIGPITGSCAGKDGRANFGEICIAGGVPSVCVSRKVKAVEKFGGWKSVPSQSCPPSNASQ